MIEDEAENIFHDKRARENKSKNELIGELYKIIGQRETEILWLKKKYKLELPGEIGFGG